MADEAVIPVAKPAILGWLPMMVGDLEIEVKVVDWDWCVFLGQYVPLIKTNRDAKPKWIEPSALLLKGTP